MERKTTEVQDVAVIDGVQKSLPAGVGRIIMAGVILTSSLVETPGDLVTGNSSTVQDN